MTKYVMWGSYCENAIEKRTPYRQVHLDGLAAQKEQGLLITLGPTQDNTMVFGIYEAENEDQVRELIEGDPYWKNGIWTEYEIKEWIQAF
ncbi:YCII-related [Gloeothece citriformis PCC 7424]|uniref:YCII-related n=1 Tax=Gloeothece citriformis (strain PCC 7424) TaxID=65393 RepID=B7K9J0_GLOC7|nr:YciI family protein [Gloeothece citriformis]ACK69958.1 YCII-related [Gloeothece citriformis PCC 7424]